MRLVAFVTVLLLGLAAAPCHAEKRVALVIGNSAYANAGTLPNAGKDAADVAAALKRLDFEVIEARDVTVGQLTETLARFADALKGTDVALMWYS
jgi:uncharacterized caspase-like protein